MIVSYFPGCTLKNKARDLDLYTRRSMEALGVTPIEPENWQCCGGVFSTAKDEIATKLSAVRALADASANGRMLVSVCSACHNVLKQTNHAMQNDPDFSAAVNRYLAPDVQYRGETRVLHYLELLRDVIGFDAVKAAVKKPLAGRRIAAYYGCLLLRPGQTMQMDDPEDPSILEDLIRALGGEPVVTPYRNECCGAYTMLEDAAAATSKSASILGGAANAGADCVITACPLCRYNLLKSATDVPVLYFTELLAEALGVKEDADGTDK